MYILGTILYTSKSVNRLTNIARKRLARRPRFSRGGFFILRDDETADAPFSTADQSRVYKLASS